MDNQLQQRINQILTELRVKYSLEGRLFLETMLMKAFKTTRRLTMTELYQCVVEADPRDLTIDHIETNVRYAFRHLDPNTPLADKLFGDLKSGQKISNKDGFYALLYELRHRCMFE